MVSHFIKGKFLMDLSNILRWTPVSVTWRDIHVCGDALDPDDYIQNFEACIRKTAGYFLAVSQDHLFICETDDRDAKTDFVAERINAFPLEVVMDVLTLNSANGLHYQP
jgi:hypothetical protein